MRRLLVGAGVVLALGTLLGGMGATAGMELPGLGGSAEGLTALDEGLRTQLSIAAPVAAWALIGVAWALGTRRDPESGIER